MINESNYESYFLNFLANALTDQEVEILMAFLKKNPELEKNLPFLNNYIVDSNKEISLNKSFLFKSLDNFNSINEDNFDEFCVAYYEKDLSSFGYEKLSNYLKLHPEKLAHFHNYGKVHINPQLDLKYPLKRELKKYSLSPFYRILYISAAAAVIFLFIYFIPTLNHVNNVNKPKFVNTDKSVSYKKLNRKNNAVIARNEKELGLATINQLKTISTNPKHFQVKLTNTRDSLPDKEINIKSINAIKINELSPSNANETINFIADIEKRNDYKNKVSYLSFKEFLMRKLHKKIDPILPANTDEHKFTWWDLATIGVNGINKLADSKLKVERKINNEGKVIAMAFESGKFSFTRSMSK